MAGLETMYGNAVYNSLKYTRLPSKSHTSREIEAGCEITAASPA